eukprot:SAG11_NODE_7547_length_1130_cov_1.315228_1_plen_58_part_10
MDTLASQIRLEENTQRLRQPTTLTDGAQWVVTTTAGCRHNVNVNVGTGNVQRFTYRKL